MAKKKTTAERRAQAKRATVRKTADDPASPLSASLHASGHVSSSPAPVSSPPTPSAPPFSPPTAVTSGAPPLSDYPPLLPRTQRNILALSMHSGTAWRGLRRCTHRRRDRPHRHERRRCAVEREEREDAAQRILNGTGIMPEAEADLRISCYAALSPLYQEIYAGPYAVGGGSSTPIPDDDYSPRLREDQDQVHEEILNTILHGEYTLEPDRHDPRFFRRDMLRVEREISSLPYNLRFGLLLVHSFFVPDVWCWSAGDIGDLEERYLAGLSARFFDDPL